MIANPQCSVPLNLELGDLFKDLSLRGRREVRINGRHHRRIFATLGYAWLWALRHLSYESP
jgi:hypothetical protein